MANKDFLKELGDLAVASRMKRLTERFFRGGNEVYRSLNVDFEPQWFALFHYLYTENAPRSIVTAAEALNVSHPAVIQTARGLVQKGLVRSFPDRDDRRKRLLSLTEKGKALALSLVPIWEGFAAGVSEVMKSARVDLLETIDRIERRLDEEDLSARILRRIKERQYEAIDIVRYAPGLDRVFKALNEDWLKRDFRVEEADAEILNHPRREIIRRGGMLFFARLDGKIIGTVAVLKRNDGVYELAKMAVAEDARGKQAGRKLADAAIAWTKSRRARSITLWTDVKLRAAMGLYRKLGFKPIAPPRRKEWTHERQKTGILMALDFHGRMKSNRP